MQDAFGPLFAAVAAPMEEEEDEKKDKKEEGRKQKPRQAGDEPAITTASHHKTMAKLLLKQSREVGMLRACLIDTFLMEEKMPLFGAMAKSQKFFKQAQAKCKTAEERRAFGDMGVRNWSNLISYLSTVESCQEHVGGFKEYNQYMSSRGMMLMSREVCICRTDKAWAKGSAQILFFTRPASKSETILERIIFPLMQHIRAKLMIGTALRGDLKERHNNCLQRMNEVE